MLRYSASTAVSATGNGNEHKFAEISSLKSALAECPHLRNHPIMTGKVVLKDVARLAGVSEMTASRALRGASDVSKATKAKVEDIAAQIGYVPNRIAGALASQRSNLVAIVVPSLGSFVFPEVLSGVSTALKDSPLKPVIGVSGYDLDEEEGVIREMLSWRPSGLIVAGLEHSDGARAMLAAADIPVVEIMDTDGTPVSHCVGISHHQAGRGMAQTIAARGYERIGFIGTKMPQDYRAGKRLDGFVDGLQAQGLTLLDRELYSGVSSVKTGRDLTARLLARSRLDCLYFSSDVMAVGGYMHCLANGLSVPDDLAIAGFNNLDLLAGLPLRLATTNAFRFEIGQKAAEIILRRSGSGADPRSTPEIVSLKAEIDPGQSL
jgi:LacI family transcriptional regulator, gluconate utilization system Gnt-I transcriptional repressor